MLRPVSKFYLGTALMFLMVVFFAEKTVPSCESWRTSSGRPTSTRSYTFSFAKEENRNDFVRNRSASHCIIMPVGSEYQTFKVWQHLNN